ncbi:MAG: alanine--tRNA ligase [Calditrichia bacterium]
MKSSKQIRAEFIQFFQDKGHTFVPSSPVVPQDDPTLLFTNAGMNQFKDVFLGTGKRAYSRAVNSQKCIRVSGKHNDLEEVGRDTYHHTFFEMLGNWSFGDYYKKEAIQWAWELLTELWKLPKDKLYATVYLDDDEAAELWPKVTDIPAERVLRFDEKDNFWEMGETGPCGPCSEIHIDLGPERCDKGHLPGHVCGVNGECGRFIELWNLVFIQYNRDETGQLHPLPEKHVDTGMGFERIVSVLQNVSSNYETDLFRPIMQKMAQIAGVDFKAASREEMVALQVIADHVRMLTFSIADGAIPSNDGRGYVLRRILRRAARFGRKLNMKEPFIFQLVPTVVEVMGEAFPEIIGQQKHIEQTIRTEEESFNKTLDRGIALFEEVVEQLRQQNQKIIPGEEAFKLYDTYGFPLDLTRVMAEEKGLLVDENGFDLEMEKQRERARKAGKFVAQYNHVDEWNVLHHCESNSVFVGYEKLEVETQICKFVRKEDQYQVVLIETPFYAESGGQVGDRGKIILDEGELEVLDVQKLNDEIVHICKSDKPLEIVKSDAKAVVSPEWRYPTMNNHTATHLLHAALRQVLGEHVQQAGSLVEPERLRFDFTHSKKVEKDELAHIEWLVNQQIRRNTPLEIFVTDFEKAKEMGAMALFGEKYGNEVRVVRIEGFSTELCGGTHVKQTGDIGLFLITEESSIASGVRRIEAVTGEAAFGLVQKQRELLAKITSQLNTPAENVPEKLSQMSEAIHELENELKRVKSAQILDNLGSLIENAEKIGEISLSIGHTDGADVDLLKKAGDKFREQAKNGVLLFINRQEEKINYVCAVTDDLIKNRGLKAGDLVREVAKITGGGGGGRPHLATAGGKNADKLEEAIARLKSLLM